MDMAHVLGMNELLVAQLKAEKEAREKARDRA